MNPILTFVTPTCRCCREPSPLLPRDDLAEGLVACSRSGQLYRAEGGRYVPASLPPLARRDQPASVQIDLSRSGYA